MHKMIQEIYAILSPHEFVHTKINIFTVFGRKIDRSESNRPKKLNGKYWM